MLTITRFFLALDHIFEDARKFSVVWPLFKTLDRRAEQTLLWNFVLF
jgi:hypothetical protein